MKRIIKFSRFFIPALIISLSLIILGIAGLYFKKINLGVDFKGGYIQEVTLAPTAFTITYSGSGNTRFMMSKTSITIIVSGASVNEEQHDFLFSSFPALDDLLLGLSGIEGVTVEKIAEKSVQSEWLIQSARSSSQLSSTPLVVHYLEPDAEAVPIEVIRASLSSLGAASVQVLGDPAERRFMIRLDNDDSEEAEQIDVFTDTTGTTEAADEPENLLTEITETTEITEIEESGVIAEETAPMAEETDAIMDETSETAGKITINTESIVTALEEEFGQGNIAVIRSDYIGSRVSEQLTTQVWYLTLLTILLILAYSAIRFKPQYAIGAVLAIIHNALIMMAFIVWTQMEFNTTTIAAILTILGYSINDTIVVFDRLRETRRIYPNDSYVDVLNRALTETMSRTLITTLTTMLAVASLYFFTTGSMKDFAMALMVGMVSGVYATIFVASGFVNFWESIKEKKPKTAVQSSSK